MKNVLYKTYRKCTVFLCASLIFLAVPSLPQQDKEEASRYYELENGLKVFLYQRATIPLLNISVSVNLGSKDETEETNGLVHILEHCILFGGTKLRSGEEVRKDIRRHGAYFNAHTTHDLITFDISLPSEFADFALKNQKEILFDLELSQEEIDKEKKVILEEIAQFKDDPIKYATSLVFQNLYESHPYRHLVVGKKEVIEAATQEQMAELYQTYFVPTNCALAVVGEFDLDEMEAKIKNVFGEVEKAALSLPQVEKAPLLEKSVELEHQMDINIGYLVIGMPGPDYNDPEQYETDVLVQILGRGVAPMLGYALRGMRKLAYSAYMSYSPEKYGGVILIYITAEPKNLKSAKTETLKFLKNTRAERYSMDDFRADEQIYIIDYLESAKNNLKLNFYQGREVSLDIASSLSRYLLLADESSEGSFLDNINKITSSGLRKVAAKYLSRGKYVIVTVSPMKK